MSYSENTKTDCAGPRERVLRALSHRKPDRIPVDFWAEPGVVERLLQDLRLANLDELLDRLQVDIRPVFAGEPAWRISSDQTMRENFWGERWRRIRHFGMDEWMHVPGGLAEIQTLRDLKSYPWPTPGVFNYGGLSKQLERNRNYAVRYGSGDLFTRPMCVRGMEEFLCDLVERPEMAHYIIGKFTDFYCQDLVRALEATKGQMDIFLMYADLGTQRGPLISMDTFETFFLPYAKKLFAIARQAGLKVLFHSCGAVRGFIPALMEAGVDILNPIQVKAVGMIPVELKRDFGKTLSFHGGIDVQETLPKGSPDDVRREVQMRIQELGHDGGYILCSTHNLQLDTPTENIVAMYDVGIR